jgi:zinc/manganese transport system substrate-binding protein
MATVDRGEELPVPSRSRAIVATLAVAAAVGLTVSLAGCSSSSSGSAAAGAGPRPIRVVAAENFWGSIAAQLGGDRVQVTSIIANPDTDPHDYEATAADARTIATAQYVIVNGVGYDPWAPKLVAANPASGRRVLTVGQLVGVPDGGNPHRWYAPPDVAKVIDQVTADYKLLDPKDAGYFDQQRHRFETQGLAGYHMLIDQIKQKYAGMPVGASESIFAPLADALGLKLLTPAGFLNAISEGADPTAQDKATTDHQIKARQVKVFVYNSQNATPDVRALVAQARAEGIPVATVTETPTPPQASFQDWQTRQLTALAAALATAKATSQ